MRLECTILRRDRRDQGEPVEVLNEVVVDRGSGPYLTKIECWERDHLITKVHCLTPPSMPCSLLVGSALCDLVHMPHQAHPQEQPSLPALREDGLGRGVGGASRRTGMPLPASKCGCPMRRCKQMA